MAHLARRLALVVPLFLALSMIALPGEIAEAGETGGAAPAADATLALGREALARGDYTAAERQLARAVEMLDPATDGAALAEAYLDLGIARLQGSGAAGEALVAFLHSAELAEQPATAYLWAAAAARRLGLAEEARRYEDRALARPMTPAPAELAPAEPTMAPRAAPGEPPPTGAGRAPAAPAERPAAPWGTDEPSGEAAFHLLFGGSRATPAPPPAAPVAGKAAAAPAAAPTPKEGRAERPEGEPPGRPLDVFRLLFGPREPKPAAEGTREAPDEPPPPPPSGGE